MCKRHQLCYRTEGNTTGLCDLPYKGRRFPLSSKPTKEDSLGKETGSEKDVLAYKDDFGTGEEPEVSGMASTDDDGSIQVMVYSHHDDWDIEQEFDVDLDISNISFDGQAVIRHYRIDKLHSNAYTEWIGQDKPKYPTKEQYAAIKSKDGLKLLEPVSKIQLNAGKLCIKFALPTHAISLLEILQV